MQILAKNILNESYIGDFKECSVCMQILNIYYDAFYCSAVEKKRCVSTMREVILRLTSEPCSFVIAKV
ncbi:hypothetical protein T05_1856 [Trichinella murrelli]|uniref:Uncharacterized protein n=1 Tax=Trichinella murrelli TaxID=144512 RepID=A0A0V0TAE1_9BILA|nr:hypothetical protein T05_1856 [Trichinella murrelli]